MDKDTDEYIRLLRSTCRQQGNVKSCEKCRATKEECVRYWKEDLIPYITQYGWKIPKKTNE